MWPFHLIVLSDRFYLDSFLVFVSTLILSGLGLLFWIVAAKIYPDGDVGIATAILSTITLIMSISRFGFDQSIIRYFPVEDKGKVFVLQLLLQHSYLSFSVPSSF